MIKKHEAEYIYKDDFVPFLQVPPLIPSIIHTYTNKYTHIYTVHTNMHIQYNFLQLPWLFSPIHTFIHFVQPVNSSYHLTIYIHTHTYKRSYCTFIPVWTFWSPTKSFSGSTHSQSSPEYSTRCISHTVCMYVCTLKNLRYNDYLNAYADLDLNFLLCIVLYVLVCMYVGELISQW